MKSKMTKFAAAIIVFVVGLVSIIFFDKTLPSAYAVEQTIEAFRKIKTLHMFCKDWNDSEYEMWIQLNPDTGIPEYCRAYWPNLKILNISRPDHSYQYNEKGNVVAINSGKLYSIGVAPALIFEDLLKCSKTKNSNIKVKIYNEYDSESGKDIIVAIVEDPPYNSRKIFIDPATKLPVRIYSLGDHCLGSFIKDVESIEYDMDLPEGVFDFEIPQGARIIDHDRNNKLLNDPQYGISTEGLTEQQAAEKIATDYWNALIAMDKATAQKVAPVTQITDAALLAELVEVGELYIQPGCGIGKVIPCKIRYKDNRLEMWKLIIKSRNISGNPSCVIAGYYDSPKEIK